MWLSDISRLLYVIAVCAAQDDSLTSPPLMGTPVNVPPVPSLQLRTNWSSVFPSEKVELSCSVSSSSSGFTFTWYRDGKKLNAGPNFSFNGDGSVLTVTATAQDAGHYSCVGQHTSGVSTGHSNLLQLNVDGKNPKPKVTRSSKFNPLFPGEKISLTCNVDESAGWEYLWFHNGQQIPASDKTYPIASVDHTHKGNYHCQAKRGKDPFYTEASETTSLQVSEAPIPTLTRDTPWPDVFEGEIVEFSCEVDNDDWTYTWYRDGVKLQEDDDMTVDEDYGSLNITSASQKYQGVYGCRAHLAFRGVSSGMSNTSTLLVYGNLPKPTLSKAPAFNPMFVGETVNFTCGVSVASGWEYQWAKDGTKLTSTSKSINVSLSSSDGGRYSCRAVRGERMLTNSSEEIQQDVFEIPVPSLTRVTKWETVFPTETVKFHCGIQNGSGWNYKWYKDAKLIQADAAVSFPSDGATLTIGSASARDKGRYECEGHLPNRNVSSRSASQLDLRVYDKKPTVTMTRDPAYAVMFPGESVSFTCQIDVPSEWEYTWYHDDSPSITSENKYLLNLTGSTNTGSYKCEAKRGVGEVFKTDLSQAVALQVKNKKPKAVITQRPDVDKLYTGESVSFDCSERFSSEWKYFWYKNGAPLPNTGGSFTVDDASLSDNGTYECKAERDKTPFSAEHSDSRTISISKIPVPSLKQETPWLDVFPTESVKFSCGMQLNGSIWRYEWYRDAEKVKADDQDGSTLSIGSAEASHRGKYRCLGELKSRAVHSDWSPPLVLEVYDKKPAVTLLQNPTHSLMHTNDSVSFHCHINVSVGWEYLWYKDGKQLPTSGNDHNITSVVTSNTGSYKCEVKRGKNAVFRSDHSKAIKIDIKERPQASIVLLTGWSEVFSTDSLVLRCDVTGSEDKWNYTWFKEGQAIEQLPSERYIVTPQNDPDQSLYTCQGIRSGRPSYSKTSDSFKTKNLLVKRRVLLTITGIIFFGIIAVFLGCIFLKVFRKPAEEDKKQEGEDLFTPNMPLKDFTDSPCPLVEYITEASLNAPSKEPEENGVICSETTPLPITALDENALMSDSPDKAENNGGLSSFQQ